MRQNFKLSLSIVKSVQQSIYPSLHYCKELVNEKKQSKAHRILSNRWQRLTLPRVNQWFSQALEKCCSVIRNASLVEEKSRVASSRSRKFACCSCPRKSYHCKLKQWCWSREKLRLPKITVLVNVYIVFSFLGYSSIESTLSKFLVGEQIPFWSQCWRPIEGSLSVVLMPLLIDLCTYGVYPRRGYGFDLSERDKNNKTTNKERAKSKRYLCDSPWVIFLTRSFIILKSSHTLKHTLKILPYSHRNIIQHFARKGWSWRLQ